jgi:hypothetical protein
MFSHRQHSALILGAGLLVGFTSALAGQLVDDPSLSAERQEVIQLLSDYSGDEWLLRPEDLQALIDKVRQMPDEEFVTWYRETRQVRDILRSPQWQETRQWLREFLAVQAIYSQEEIDEFRRDIARMSPSELVDVLRRIRRKHQSLIAMRASSERNRRQALASREESIRQRQAADAAARAAPRGDFGFPSAAGSRGPRRSSYAERMRAYRRDFVWPGGYGWWRW